MQTKFSYFSFLGALWNCGAAILAIIGWCLWAGFGVSVSLLQKNKESDQRVGWKRGVGSSHLTSHVKISHYPVTKTKARKNWVLCKDDFPIYFPDFIVNSYSKIQACGRGIYFTESLRVLLCHIQLLRSTEMCLSRTICMQHREQGPLAIKFMNNLLRLDS